MAASWAAIGTSPRSVVSVQATTEAAPADAADGFSLDEVAGFIVFLAADNGQTLNAAGGSLLGYRYASEAALWSRASELDITLVAADIGGRSASWVFQVASPRGRIAHIASNVGVSGGGLTLRYLASYLSGKDG